MQPLNAACPWARWSVLPRKWNVGMDPSGPGSRHSALRNAGPDPSERRPDDDRCPDALRGWGDGWVSHWCSPGQSAAAVIAASAGQPLPVDVLVVGTGIVGGLVTARASVGAWTRRRRRTLKRVIDWLDERIATTGQPPARSFPGYPTGQENPLPVLPPAPASLPPGSGE